MVTESEQAATILAALNSALAPAVAYEYDKVPGAFGNPGQRPGRFALVSIVRRFTDSRRASGETSLNGHRITVRYAAKSTNDARTMRARTTEALENQILAGDVGPFTFETSQAIAPDDGYLSGSDTWTF